MPHSKHYIKKHLTSVNFKLRHSGLPQLLSAQFSRCKVFLDIKEWYSRHTFLLEISHFSLSSCLAAEISLFREFITSVHAEWRTSAGPCLDGVCFVLTPSPFWLPHTLLYSQADETHLKSKQITVFSHIPVPQLKQNLDFPNTRNSSVPHSKAWVPVPCFVIALETTQSKYKRHWSLYVGTSHAHKHLHETTQVQTL